MSKLIILLFISLFFTFKVEAGALAKSQIVGNDEAHKVDVILEDGERKMLVKSTSVPEGLGNLVFLVAKNGVNENIAQNCSATQQTFTIPAELITGKDLVIQELRFSSLCSGIKIDKGLCGNQAWTNGILVRVTSEGVAFDFLPITVTATFESRFAFGAGGKYQLVFGSGADFMSSTFSPNNPFILRKGTADKIEVFCRDNMTQASVIEFIGFGFKDD